MKVNSFEDNSQVYKIGARSIPEQEINMFEMQENQHSSAIQNTEPFSKLDITNVKNTIQILLDANKNNDQAIINSILRDICVQNDKDLLQNIVKEYNNKTNNKKDFIVLVANSNCADKIRSLSENTDLENNFLAYDLRLLLNKQKNELDNDSVLSETIKKIKPENVVQVLISYHKICFELGEKRELASEKDLGWKVAKTNAKSPETLTQGIINSPSLNLEEKGNMLKSVINSIAMLVNKDENDESVKKALNEVAYLTMPNREARYQSTWSLDSYINDILK